MLTLDVLCLWRRYAKVTLRDLLRWVSTFGTGDASKADWLGRTAWLTYGGRFRTDQCQGAVATVIKAQLGWDPVASRATSHLKVLRRGARVFDIFYAEYPIAQVKLPSGPELKLQALRRNPLAEFDDEVWTQLSEANDAVYNALFVAGRDSLTELPLFNAGAVFLIVEQLVRGAPLFRAACDVYGSSLRSPKDRHSVLNAIRSVLGDHHAGALSAPSRMSKAFVLNAETKEAVQVIVRGLATEQPVLVCGPSGCGKSLLVRAIAGLMNFPLEQLFITNQTEPAALVGSILPQKGAAPKWVDGAVSEAVERGQWLVLENISEGQPQTLERLNPVLEKPSQWTKTENDEVKATPIHPNFRVLATMVPPQSGLQNVTIQTSTELSPALANRFTIVNVRGLHAGSPEAEVLDQLRVACPSLAVDTATAVSQVARPCVAGTGSLLLCCQQFQTIWRSASSTFAVTPRHLALIGDCAHTLLEHPRTHELKLSSEQIAKHAFMMVAGAAVGKDGFMPQVDLSKANFLDSFVAESKRNALTDYVVTREGTPSRCVDFVLFRGFSFATVFASDTSVRSGSQPPGSAASPSCSKGPRPPAKRAWSSIWPRLPASAPSA